MTSALITRLAAAGFFSAATFIASAQSATSVDPRVLPAQILSAPPKLDGVLSPGEWPEEVMREGFFTPDTAQPAPRTARFWLTYDQQYIYFAAQIEADPNLIVKEEYRQNVGLASNDAIRIAIDSQGSLQSFNNFAFNPSGATSVQLAGGRANKVEWSGSFEANARVTATGWEGEARIPWSLIVSDVKDTRDLRFNIGWSCMATKREYLWQVHRGDLTRIGIWKDVQLNVPAEPRSLMLLPYGYVGANRDGLIANAGIDMKTSLNESIIAVGTINPDFRNIENQILSLDFSYLERLSAEARPFFLEGANYLQTGYDQRLFTSQRIRDFDFGAKAYGRLSDRTTFGVLSTFDFGQANANVINIDHKPTPRSTISGSYVGFQSPGKDNHGGRLLYGQLVGGFDIYGLMMATDDEEFGRGTNSRIGYYRESGNWETFFEYAHVTSNFFPRIGFAPERNFAGFYAGFENQVHYQKSPTVAYTEWDVFYQNQNRLNGDIYRRDFEVSFGAALKNQLYVDVSHTQRRFEQFNDSGYGLYLEYPREDRYRRLAFQAASGRVRGDAYLQMSLEALYRPIPYLQVSAGAEYVNHTDDQTQIIVSANYDLSRYESLGGRLSVQDGRTNWYLSFRRSGGNGNEYFLIIGDPNTETFRTQVILKAVIPIKIRY